MCLEKEQSKVTNPIHDKQHQMFFVSQWRHYERLDVWNQQYLNYLLNAFCSNQSLATLAFVRGESTGDRWKYEEENMRNWNVRGNYGPVLLLIRMHHDYPVLNYHIWNVIRFRKI